MVFVERVTQKTTHCLTAQPLSILLLTFKKSSYFKLSVRKSTHFLTARNLKVSTNLKGYPHLIDTFKGYLENNPLNITHHESTPVIMLSENGIHGDTIAVCTVAKKKEPNPPLGKCPGS